MRSPNNSIKGSGPTLKPRPSKITSLGSKKSTTGTAVTSSNINICKPKDTKFRGCDGTMKKMELPFTKETDFCMVGNTVIHVLPCKTDWDHSSVAGDSCSVCKTERGEIIAKINEQVHKRLYGGDDSGKTERGSGTRKNKDKLESPAQNVSGSPSGAPSIAVEGGSDASVDVNTARSANSVNQAARRGRSPSESRRHSQHGRSESRKSASTRPQSKKNVILSVPGGGGGTSGAATNGTVSKRSSINASRESVNITYGGWDKVKEQTLATLYDANPDIDKLYSMFVQVRRIRMNCAEMSNICNESQALLDSTVSQLYTSMTDVCRENMKLNKMHDTDMAALIALIEATQMLKQQLVQFNIYDRDSVIKSSEQKIKERLKRTIQHCAQSKNKDLLTELIILMKNNTVLRCNDLLELARRQVQGLTYDDFITKHSNRLAPNKLGKSARAKQAKEETELKEELNKLLTSVGRVEEYTDWEIESAVLMRFMKLLENNLDSSNTVDQTLHDGLELYFRIIRASIRRTLQTNRGADSVRRLRTVLRTHGNSLPLRFQTLEILQLVDKFQAMCVKIETDEENSGMGDIKQDIQPLITIAEKICMLTTSADFKKIIPPKLDITVELKVGKLQRRSVM